MTQSADIAIVGGGIVGLATAYQLSDRHPELKTVVLEKEDQLAAHQTGHNSGVLHSGVYYRPDSLKAKNCRQGKEAMERFCSEYGVPYEICGKVIVAVTEDELPRLDKILQRGQQNGVRCEIVDANRLRELEPHAAGIRAIHVPEAGIVNFRRACERMGEIVIDRGGEIHCGHRVREMRIDDRRVRVITDLDEFDVGYVVNCAGLQSDRMTRVSGQQPEARIIPFRGEYYELKPDQFHLCRNLIYPVPDPNFPFLGVHFTRMIDGGIECGPNAVLAFAREGYTKTDLNARDLIDALSYPGFLRLAARYWRVGAGEMWRSFSKSAFVKALQRLMPEIRSEHLVPARAGVRAQAIARDGSMVDDFVIQTAGHVVNVGNAPSPAATSSLNIGQIITEELTAIM
jgi:L-2-hydroxyglutarate oxidase LhgO